MEMKINQFLEHYDGFDELPATGQIIRLVYFHTVVERRETVSLEQLARLFELSHLRVPPNLAKVLAYLCGRGGKLLHADGEYRLQRGPRKELQDEYLKLSGATQPPKIGGAGAFEFGDRVFKDKKVQELLGELRKCYAQQCWNAAGLLTRIVVERALDSIGPGVKAKRGLKDKINLCLGDGKLLSASVREGLGGLHGTKIIGDIAAHHSSILLDKNDIDLVLPAFRMLLKEAKAV